MNRSTRLFVPALLSLILLATAPLAAQEGTGFDALFTGRTLRIDLHHSGSRAEESFTLDALIEEGAWAGSRRNMQDESNLGAYRFVMYDAETDRAIFSRNFSSLFGEWRTTGEAQKIRRTMHETVLAPMPRAPVYVTLARRGPNNSFREIFTAEVDPASRAVIRERPCSSYEITDIAVTGPSSERLDLLIVGDGYTERQAEKFHRDARRFTRLILGFAPFDSNRSRINVRSLRAPSEQPGTDEPRKGIFRKTAAGTSFNTFDLERYLTAPDNRRLRDLTGCAPYDRLLVVVNSARYGGAGIHDLWAVTTSDNEYSDYVAVHELGHSLAGLGDEYYTSDVAYNEFYPPGVEPWEPNISALVPDGRPKWVQFLSLDAPVPTPPDKDRYGSVVGAFEGAGYAARGLYRPALDCMMLSKSYVPFDPICSAAIQRIIMHYSVDEPSP